MAEQLSTPRITAPYLDNFVNRHVLLVGKVTQLRGEQATLDSEGTVTVILNRVRVCLASICLLQTCIIILPHSTRGLAFLCEKEYPSTLPDMAHPCRPFIEPNH
jgi:hypothetical protein